MEKSIKEKFLTLEKPTVLKGTLHTESWKSVAWDWRTLIEQCGSLILHFRVVPKSDKGPVFEGDSKFIEASITDFVRWVRQDFSGEPNPFVDYSQDEYWIYSGYNYVDQKFPETNLFRKGLDWSVFGVERSSGKESTFWIGSKGAYTPCHVDTYGFNLVAQIIGRKQWILFPPDDKNFMYSTRIPYEESSIFSCVNILNPNLNRHPLFQNSHPHIVTLEPGDVLFVPVKWWHFVHCLDHSVSVNTWIDVDTDNESRFEESVTRALFTALYNVCDSVSEEWLSPQEEVSSFVEAVELVNIAFQQVSVTEQFPSVKNTHNDESSCSRASKIPRLNKETCVPRNIGVDTDFLFNDSHAVSPIMFKQFIENYCSKRKLVIHETEESCSNSYIDLKALVNCVLHPDVISCITQRLRANLR